MAEHKQLGTLSQCCVPMPGVALCNHGDSIREICLNCSKHMSYASTHLTTNTVAAAAWLAGIWKKHTYTLPCTAAQTQTHMLSQK